MTDYSIRSVPFELRTTGDGLTLEGLAAPFNSPTRIHERGRTFDEVIAPGAFHRTLNSADRVVMQYDHGQHPVFGSLPIGRIDDMRETPAGLHVTARLNDSWMTEPIRSAIANGAVTGMSFRFSVPDGGDTWDRTGDIPKRTVNEVKLYELGPVTSPAYEATTVAVRSALNLLSDEERHALADELNAPEPDPEATPDEGSPAVNPDTPDEGSRTRPINVRRALARLHGIPA
jgi:HK97 family phage prohead protease